MGQIFSTELGAEHFSEALDAMAPGLSEEVGFVNHAWFRRWLDLAKTHPTTIQTDWVARDDLKESLVLPDQPNTSLRPFSLPLFSLDYGLAYSLHRDCILSRMTKTILKRFLAYEEGAKLHAFPEGSTLHGTCAAKCVYLWKARPPSHRAWHKDHGIAGFIKNETLPSYFHDRVEIVHGWNDKSLEIPWETEEETRLRLEESDTLSNSALAEQAIEHAGKKRPPVTVVDLSGSAAAPGSMASGDMWDVEGRTNNSKRVRSTASIPLTGTALPSTDDFQRIGHEDPPPDMPLESRRIANNAPPAAKPAPVQYAPALARVDTGSLPFGRPREPPTSDQSFNPFQSSFPQSMPIYTKLHSPVKGSIHDLTGSDVSSSARRQLRSLLDASAGTMAAAAATDWTFRNVHEGNKSIRAYAKFSSLLAIHDVEWQGFIQGQQAVPEEWKIFPGPLYHQFRDRFFSLSSTTKDAISWIQAEYRSDRQTRLADPRLRPDIQDNFWCKEVFEDLRQGNFGFHHPIQQSDVDNNFSIFAFILSIDKTAVWPPRLPQNGFSIEEMLQLGRNVLWFFDLAMTQPGQSGSLFLTFSLLGEALLHQFELLDHRDLRDQWNASSASRRNHSFFFLLWTHRLLAEMQRWYTSEPLVFYVTPAESPLSHVMALSPRIANRRGSQGNIWSQRRDWMKSVSSTFQENFAHCQTLRSDPPQWIFASAAARYNDKKGEYTKDSNRDKRDRKQPPPPTTVTPSSSSSPPAVVEHRTSHPLFALSPKLSTEFRGQQPGQLLYHMKKVLKISAPLYGSSSAKNTRVICFNFTTEGFCRCDGIHSSRPAGKTRTCNRLHICLSPTSPHASDPAEYFVEIVRYLQNPAVGDFFVPTEEFATSKRYLDAVALL
jgi:hypothetical protein